MDNQDSQESTRAVVAQFVRFNIVGIVNTLLAYLVYAVLVFFGVRPALAVIADYAAGICIGFFLNRRYTFTGQHGKAIPMFGRLILVYVPVAAANVIILEILVGRMGMNKYVTQFGVMIVLACVAFVLQKLFVFGKKEIVSHG